MFRSDFGEMPMRPLSKRAGSRYGESCPAAFRRDYLLFGRFAFGGGGNGLALSEVATDSIRCGQRVRSPIPVRRLSAAA